MERAMLDGRPDPWDGDVEAFAKRAGKPDFPVRWRIHSAMYFPDERLRPAALFAGIVARGVNAWIDSLSDDSGAVLKGAVVKAVRVCEPLADELMSEAYRQRFRPKRGSRRSAGVHAGEIAALVLTVPLTLNAKGEKAIGRTAAYRLVRYLLAEEGIAACDDRTLKRVWKQYSSGAHLWAAYQVMDEPNIFSMDLPRFLSIAEAFRLAGESYTPLHSRETLLDPRFTWKPDQPWAPAAIPFDSVTLPDGWMRALRAGAPTGDK